MVLSRKKRQLLKAELNNNVTTPQIEKKEDVTGKKRKRGVQKKIQGKMGIQLEGKLEPFLPENGEVKVKKVASLNNNDGNQTKKMKISEEGSGKEVGCVLKKEEKVVSLNNNSNNNSESKKKKKKKKKKVKKKKTKVEEVVQEKPQSEVEIDGVLEQEKPQSVVGNAGISQQIVQATSKGNAGDARKVYVGGMPYYSTEDDIRSYFEYCGAITDIDCMTFPETGKFRGIAMITFETEDAAKSALELDGSDMEGLYLKIEPYKTTRPAKTSSFSPPVIEGYYRIYAGNLSWDITEADLRKLFADCNITSIRFGEDKETGNFKGYAHVDFADDASLNKALRLDQKFVCGRPVKISRAVPKKGAVRNGVAPSTEVKPANSQEVNSVVAPENNSVLNPVVTPENKTAANSAVTPENDSAVNSVVPPPENKSGVSASKLKRRTCYDCGERGHVSSDCPKNQKS